MTWLKNLMPFDWRRLDLSRRRSLLATLLLVTAISVVAVSLWLRVERVRLSQRESEAEVKLKVIQADLAEIERLKAGTLPPKLNGPALQDTVVASLASHRLSLSVAVLDADRLRVHGAADFDTVIRWLGDVQQSHRLGAASFSASRQKGMSTIDITLISDPE
jgi:type II secretory pathway component PulM